MNMIINGATVISGGAAHAHEMSDIDFYTRQISDTGGVVIILFLIVFILVVKYAYREKK